MRNFIKCNIENLKNAKSKSHSKSELRLLGSGLSNLRRPSWLINLVKKKMTILDNNVIKYKIKRIETETQKPKEHR